MSQIGKPYLVALAATVVSLAAFLVMSWLGTDQSGTATATLDELLEQRDRLVLRLRSAPPDMKSTLDDYTVVEAEGTTASETLLVMIRSALEQAGGRQSSAGSSAKTIAPGFAEISIRLEAELSENGLLEFARVVEGGKPALIFRSIEVRPNATSPLLVLAAELVAFGQDAT